MSEGCKEIGCLLLNFISAGFLVGIFSILATICYTDFPSLYYIIIKTIWPTLPNYTTSMSQTFNKSISHILSTIKSAKTIGCLQKISCSSMGSVYSLTKSLGKNSFHKYKVNLSPSNRIKDKQQSYFSIRLPLPNVFILLMMLKPHIWSSTWKMKTNTISSSS